MVKSKPNEKYTHTEEVINQTNTKVQQNLNQTLLTKIFIFSLIAVFISMIHHDLPALQI